jgi:peptidyl-prolyl cis-trans isomerase B (cyclophilin B)
VKLRLLAPLVLSLGLLLAACGNEADNDPAAEPTTAEESTGDAPSDPDEPASEAPAGTCTYTADGSTPAVPVDPPSTTPTATKNVSAVLATNAGDLNLVLRAASAPCTVNSFLSLAEQGYFDQTQCHRLTTDLIWVLQCGDPTATGTGGPGYAFADELSGSEVYSAGTLAMANAGPGTNGSQFFLVYKDSLGLPPDYTVFGKFDAASIRVLQQVASKGTGNGGTDGPPAEPVEIQSVTVR